MTAATDVDRRQLLALAGAMGIGAVGWAADARSGPGRRTVKLACFIRYQIDPFQKEAFRDYASRWGAIIPRCGGHLIGYFLPAEGTNDIAWGLIGFDSLADYERYRGRLKVDPESMANFEAARSKRFILREERSLVELVDGTFDRPPR